MVVFDIVLEATIYYLTRICYEFCQINMEKEQMNVLDEVISIKIRVARFTSTLWQPFFLWKI